MEAIDENNFWASDCDDSLGRTGHWGPSSSHLILIITVLVCRIKRDHTLMLSGSEVSRCQRLAICLIWTGIIKTKSLLVKSRFEDLGFSGGNISTTVSVSSFPGKALIVDIINGVVQIVIKPRGDLLLKTNSLSGT